MTERALQAAIAIFARWEAEQEHTPVDRVVAAEFRSRRYLNAGERRWVSSIVYGCVRYRNRQEWLLERLGLAITPEHVIRLWADAPAETAGRSAEEEAAPGSVSADSEREREGASPAAETERNRGMRSPPVADPAAIRAALAALPGIDALDEMLRVTLSFPEALAAELRALLHDEAAPAAAALNEQAPVTLRVNPLRVGREHLMRALPEAIPTRFSPWGLELPRRVNVHDLPGFRTGWFEVQEEASQLAALLVDALPGETVVDVGAGAGGKTLALAAMMDNRGRLVALDTHEPRLEELKKRAERAGVTCVETLLTGADEEGTWQPSATPRRSLNRLWGQADRVLVDAPCTGSGVLRRSPDGKWREMDTTAMIGRQDHLLQQAALLVAPGGHLIYVTCAFERAQDEDVIDRFLTSQMGRHFVLEPVAQRLISACTRAAHLALLPLALRGPKAKKRSGAAPQESGPGVTPVEVESLQAGERSNDSRPEGSALQTSTQGAVKSAAVLMELVQGPFLRTWPHRHGLDAFFAACLRRSQETL